MATRDNLINIAFTHEETERINQAIAEIHEVLAGKVINLTPEERSKFGSLGRHNEVWVRKTKHYMDQVPDLVPNYINKPNFDADMKAFDDMKPWINALASVQESLVDTSILIGRDLYQSSIAFYRHMKVVSQQNVPGSTSIYQDLAKRFERNNPNG